MRAPQEAITFQVRPAACARRSEREAEAVSASLVGFDFPGGGEGAAHPLGESGLSQVEPLTAAFEPATERSIEIRQISWREGDTAPEIGRL